MGSRRTAGTRNIWARIATALVPALLPLGVAMAQSPPFQEAKTLSSAAEPIERNFDIGQAGAGKYKITLTDLGATLTAPGPAPLASVQVVITRGVTVVAVLDGKEKAGVTPSPVDTMEFDATAGTYTAHVVGIPGPNQGSGPVGVKIESVATPTTTVLDLSGTIAPPAETDSRLRTYQLVLDVPATGDYEMTLTDLAFPGTGMFDNASAYVFQAGGSSLVACLNLTVQPPLCAPTQTVTLTGGQQYQLIAGGALAVGMDGGLFSVTIKSVATGAVLHTRTVELGAVKRISDTSFQLDTGPYTLSRKDLEFPSKLSGASVIVTSAGQMVALANATTPDAALTVAADDTPHDVFAYAKADNVAPATGAGTFSVELLPASGPSALSYVSAMGDSSGSPVAYTFPVDIATSGKYTVKFGDFQYPASLGASRIAVVQNGSVVSKTDAGSSASQTLDATLVPGRATLVVIVKPVLSGGTATQTGGTFGLEMALGNAQNILDLTQGVGGVASVRKVSITSAGLYDLKISDLAAPDVFGDLSVVLSRGSTKIGTAVVGSGGSNPKADSATLTDLNLPVGNYAITLLAQPGTATKAATYGLSMNASPPAPTVTLTATPTSVESGKPVGLTWTSQGATSCTASSNPTGAWTGSKSTSGTDSSNAITAETTFTIRCSDSNTRTTEKSVTVSITAQNNGGGGGGGGGAFDWLTLAALTLAVGFHLNRRRAAGRAASR